MTHICLGKLGIIGLDNGLSTVQLKAIIWTNAGMLLIEPLGTNFNEILIEIQIFSFKKMHLKMSSAKNDGHFFLALMCQRDRWLAGEIWYYTTHEVSKFISAEWRIYASVN